MKDLMEQIVSLNKSANDKLKKANKDKENAFKEVELEKQELIQKMRLKTDNEIERLSRTEHEKLKDFEADMKLYIEAGKDNLKKIYDSNHEHWTKSLVDGVLSQYNK